MCRARGHTLRGEAIHDLAEAAKFLALLCRSTGLWQSVKRLVKPVGTVRPPPAAPRVSGRRISR